ncbi:MAG: AraC family transcriptional regulator [Schaedlerella sp.]|nr:AraC family transcriptional regulator [Schaedlerella sp.]
MENNYEKRGYLVDDFRLFHLNDAQGTKIEYHYHEFCKLLMLCSGKGGYSVDGHHYSLEAGDIVLIGSHCVHKPEFERGIPYERIIIYISPEFLQRQSTGECRLEEIFDGTKGAVLRPDEHEKKLLFKVAERLEKELSGNEYGRVVLSNSFLLRLLVGIGRNLRTTEVQTPSPVVPTNKRVLDILNYIDDHLAEEISIDELSEQFFISKYHMMRLFRKETGVSIHNHLTERRLIYARELIRQGVSATDSCFQAGFHSYSSFTRAYGKRFGTTPTGRHERSVMMEETYE